MLWKAPVCFQNGKEIKCSREFSLLFCWPKRVFIRIVVLRWRFQNEKRSVRANTVRNPDHITEIATHNNVASVIETQQGKVSLSTRVHLAHNGITTNML